MKESKSSDFSQNDCNSNSGRTRLVTTRQSKIFAIITVVMIISLGFAGCSGPSKNLPVVYTFAGLHTEFVNQDSGRVDFPDKYQGGLFIMSFIYTHCPYVCPMTVNNLQRLQDSLTADGIHGIRFVSLTYDPNRDTPDVLRKYAEERGIKFNDWDFLTGTKTNIDSVVGRVRIKYNFMDSTRSRDGKLTYFVHHPDECLLVDGQGGVRGIYSGSHLDYASVISDIKALR